MCAEFRFATLFSLNYVPVGGAHAAHKSKLYFRAKLLLLSTFRLSSLRVTNICCAALYRNASCAMTTNSTFGLTVSATGDMIGASFLALYDRQLLVPDATLTQALQRTFSTVLLVCTRVNRTSTCSRIVV